MWLEHPVYPSLCNVTSISLIIHHKESEKYSEVKLWGVCVGYIWPTDYGSHLRLLFPSKFPHCTRGGNALTFGMCPYTTLCPSVRIVNKVVNFSLL